MVDIQEELNKWIDEVEDTKGEFLADLGELYEDFFEINYYRAKRILDDLSTFVGMDTYETEKFANTLDVDLLSLEVLKYLILHRGRIPNIFIAYKDNDEMKLAIEDIVRDYNRILDIGEKIIAELLDISYDGASTMLDFVISFKRKVKELGLYEEPKEGEE